MILALRTKKPVELQRPAQVERPLSGRPIVRRAQLASRAVERVWGRVSQFVFHDVATIVVADVRHGSKALGRLLLKPVNPALNGFERAYGIVSRKYPPMLGWALDHKPIVVCAAFGLVVLAYSLAFQVGAELIPPLTQGEFAFELKLPEGKALQHTDAMMRDLERAVASYPDVKTVFSSVGGSNRNQFARQSHEENFGQLYVVMKEKNNKEAERRTIQQIRSRLQAYPEVSYTFTRPTLFSVKTPIEVEIYGFDLTALRNVASLVAKRMETIRGLSDIQTSTQLGNPEIQIRFDREKLARLGLDESQISGALRAKIRGDVASRYREDDKQIEILVRANEADRNTVADIKDLTINATAIAPNTTPQPAQDPRNTNDPRDTLRDQPVQPAQRTAPVATPAGRTIPPPIRLGAVADVVVDRGPSEVRRIRSQRAAVVSANLTGRDLSSASEDIRAELQRLRATEIPPEMTVALGGQNEELMTSYKSLLLALALAVFLVYLVMASEFESLIHPFIILFSVPFGLVGVVFSLYLTNTTFSVMAFLGVIILAGIVVNNAIVLIDFTNQLREEGYTKREALKMAGAVRMRPILMTTLTSVLGLVPMALGWGEGAEIRTPMAITIIGGLAFATLLTLVFIPVVYEMVDRKVFAADRAAAHASREEAFSPAALPEGAGD
jgi:HAE1 family hydrophobic/amphiphilic exporter-1